MRTTVDLDLDLIQTAKELAAHRGVTAGQIISELMRKALASSPSRATVRNGVPLLRRRPGGRKATLAVVNQLRDDG
jgi:hypothetical protein